MCEEGALRLYEDLHQGNVEDHSGGDAQRTRQEAFARQLHLSRATTHDPDRR